MKARLGSDIIRCVGYGHIGDGNMHLNITSKAYSHQVMDKIEPFLYEWTSEQNGSISAEHGIHLHSVSKVHFWVQKLQILEKLEMVNFYFCVKIDFFSGKKFEMYLNFRA